MEGHGGHDLRVTEYWEIRGEKIYVPDLYKAMDYMAKRRAKDAEEFGEHNLGPMILSHDGESVRVQYTRPFRTGDE